MSILGPLLFIFIFILIFGFSIIAGIVKAIFGIGGSNKRTDDSTRRNQRNEKEYTQNNNSTDKRKKLFDKDEGEYVDFEEVKENE